jgi:hypothetical protein
MAHRQKRLVGSCFREVGRTLARTFNLVVPADPERSRTGGLTTLGMRMRRAWLRAVSPGVALAFQAGGAIKRWRASNFSER